jgi:hypothetical protein
LKTVDVTELECRYRQPDCLVTWKNPGRRFASTGDTASDVIVGGGVQWIIVMSESENSSGAGHAATSNETCMMFADIGSEFGGNPWQQ